MATGDLVWRYIIRFFISCPYRCSGKTLTEEEFWQMKEELALTQCFGLGRNQRESISEGDTIFKEEGNTLTKVIRERYQSILDGSLNSLLFVHLKTENGIEVSGHIDLTQRLLCLIVSLQKYCLTQIL